MSMIEQSWYKQPRFLTVLLLPLSCIFWLISTLRVSLYKLKILKAFKANVPIIVVGNISVGGNGKTPFVIWLAEYLQQQGLKVAVISRGYGGKSSNYPLLVTQKTTPSEAGDEPVLIQRRLGCVVMVGPNRQASIEKLQQEHAIDIIISDDGMQHYKMARDIECCIVDSERQFGNGFLMPAGPLRETKARLKSVDVVVENGGATNYRYDLVPSQFRSVASFERVSDTLNTGHAISAIGNPLRFELSLKQQGIDLLSTHHFRDHYNYQPTDFSDFENDAVFMTEKDAVKCFSFAKPNWYYLPVDARPTAAVIEKLHSLLKQKGILHGL
ncbi:tetraacyldisaccharide 4'-kinase [Pseudoalteromonas lipolytica]